MLRRVSWTDEHYIQALRSPSAGRAPEVLADLRGRTRAALGKAFGRQMNEAELDDITQESLLRVHERLESFAGQSRFTTWTISVAVRCALSELRRRQYAHVSFEDAVADGSAMIVDDGGELGATDEERLARLRDGLEHALTDRQREATLAKLSGLPLIEIARRLSTTQGAIYKLLHDARRRLKDHVLQVADDGGGAACARAEES
jgi:RNA polymerase sigma-70 factor (ECF subfamily)